jgi:hypothetical protein
MRSTFCRVALMVTLLPVLASAQQGLGSASLPNRDLRIPPPREVFGAGPRTYRPDPHRLGVPIYGTIGEIYPTAPQVIVVQVPREAEPAPAPPPAPAPYVAGTPGRAKTFYVIPGCYAGDRRPQPDRLPAGCALSRLRVVPPA